MAEAPPAIATEAVLVESVKVDAPVIQGHKWADDGSVDYQKLLESYATSGFQAQHFGGCVDAIRQMLAWDLSQEEVADDEDDEFKTPEQRECVRTKIFLGYTSNLISSGLRETFAFLVKHKLVHCIVTTAGGIEEDIIKCLGPTHVGDFATGGHQMRVQGLNRIGNMFVPNENYCKFEDFIMPVINAMHDEQEKFGVVWTPSRIIHRLGKEINNEDSVCYWAYKNNIPIFSPAITDGSIGDMLYFHSYKRPGFIVDLVLDVRAMNDEAVKSRKTGVIILGGGVTKHHIMNANLMRNGADFAVYVNTAQEYDGCDSGARPDEAVSWGKIKVAAKPVKLTAEATLVFPLLVAQAFAPNVARYADLNLGPSWVDRIGQADAPAVESKLKLNKSVTTAEQVKERIFVFGK